LWWNGKTLDVETLGVLTPKPVEIEELVAVKWASWSPTTRLFLIPRSVTPSPKIRAQPLSLARI